MSTSDLKLELFRKIDALDSSSLAQVFGFVQNLQSGFVDEAAWELLSTDQKAGILNVGQSITEGKGVAHEEVVKRMMRKLGND